MCLENVDFVKVESSMMAASAIFAAINVLKRSQLHQQLGEQLFIDMSKLALIKAKCHTKFDSVESLARQMLEFYQIFDKWHCGLN